MEISINLSGAPSTAPKIGVQEEEFSQALHNPETVRTMMRDRNLPVVTLLSA